jgi:hypothetical protein
MRHVFVFFSGNRLEAAEQAARKTRAVEAEGSTG